MAGEYEVTMKTEKVLMSGEIVAEKHGQLVIQFDEEDLLDFDYREGTMVDVLFKKSAEYKLGDDK